jgi:NTE family protein
MSDTNPTRHDTASGHDALLLRLLAARFDGIDDEALALLREQLEWVTVHGGDALMRQGDPGDAMYLVVSGRLRAYVDEEPLGAPGEPPAMPAGVGRAVREMARGEVIGEMSLYTGEPRSATVVAIRDSVLVRLGKAAFDALVARSASVSTALARQLVRRMQHEEPRSLMARPVTMALVPASDGVDAADLAARLADALRPLGRVSVVDAAAIEHALGAGDTGEAEQRRIALLLDRLESEAEFVLLVADDHPSRWTRRACRHADEILLLADATRPAALHANERECLMNRPPHSEAAEILVLLHPADTEQPRDTRDWLARRPVTDHLHLRLGHAGDLARLARIQSRQAVGLVFAGGGARGLAHLGVMAELAARGIEIDALGGTSIGSVMAVYAASARPLETVMANARVAFGSNPTGDMNPVPLMSLLRGQRLRRVLETAATSLVGDASLGLEDLWKPCFAVATNYSRAREQVMRRGPLGKALRASIAIPGALPPVLDDGDLLCDGGTFNNFPVDVMRQQRGIGYVIGVDLSAGEPRKIELDEMPSSWALVWDRLKPRSSRRYRLPSLTAYLLNVTILNSVAHGRRARAMADLCFQPPLHRVGLLQWSRFDEIVMKGRQHAKSVLDDPAVRLPWSAAQT